MCNRFEHENNKFYYYYYYYFFFERDNAVRKCSMSVTDLLTKLLYSCRIKIYAIVDT